MKERGAAEVGERRINHQSRAHMHTCASSALAISAPARGIAAGCPCAYAPARALTSRHSHCQWPLPLRPPRAHHLPNARRHSVRRAKSESTNSECECECSHMHVTHADSARYKNMYALILIILYSYSHIENIANSYLLTNILYILHTHTHTHNNIIYYMYAVCPIGLKFFCSLLGFCIRTLLYL
jgi:hypothetical protein